MQNIQDLTYSITYIKNLKALMLIKDTYDIRPVLTKNGEFSFKRHDIEKENSIMYAFARCCKITNIRTMEQLNHMILKFKDILNITAVDLAHILSKAGDIKQVGELSEKRIKNMEQKLKHVLNIDHKIKMIKRFGKAVLTLPKQEFNEGAFYRFAFGWVDLQRAIILIDNINLNLLYNTGFRFINTDKNGIFLDTVSENVISYDIGRKETVFTLWQGTYVKRLYFNNAQRYNNYIVVKQTHQTPIETTRFQKYH